MKKPMAVAVAFAIASCAGTSQYHGYPDIAAHGKNTATLHILRKNSAFGSAIGAPVEVDGYLIGRIGPGGSLSTAIPAKKITISSTTSSVIVDAKKGQTYFYEVVMPAQVWMTSPGFEITAITEQRAKALGYK